MSDQPEPTRDYHDVPFPEGTQPATDLSGVSKRGEQTPDAPTQPTGEWTEKTVKRLLDVMASPHLQRQNVANAINAALESAKQDFAKQIAAERQRADRMEKLLRSMSQERVKDYFDLLAAERELAKVGAK